MLNRIKTPQSLVWLKLISCLAINSIHLWATISVHAQLIPDNTLGTQSSSVTPQRQEAGERLPPAFCQVPPCSLLIRGGAIRGSNLFHSFQEFNVGNQQQVYFANPPGISNILTRVTGNNVSNILGTLGVEGGANLFLINPNGIIFGANARLDIAGSFMATTANSIIFNNYQFSSTNPESPPLLTINVPLGLQFGANPGTIEVIGNGHDLTAVPPLFLPFGRQSSDSGLQVEPGNTLALVGGNITITGGVVTAESGRIELGAVRARSAVRMTTDPRGWKLDYSGVESFGDIAFTSQALVDVSGVGSGSVQVQARNQQMRDGSVIWAENFGSLPSGNININATESLNISGTSRDATIRTGLFTQALAGEGGNIAVNTKRLLMSGGGTIAASSFNSSSGGSVTVNASEFTRLTGVSPINPVIQTSIATFTFAASKAGGIDLTTGRLIVEGGANVTSSAFSFGDSGTVNVRALDSVEIIGLEPNILSPSNLSAIAFGEGKASNVTIETGALLIRDGGTVVASSVANGDAGNVTVNASRLVQISGTAPRSINPSLLGAYAIIAAEPLQQLFGLPPVPSGDSGSVTINTPLLKVFDGGFVNVRNDGTGNSGRIAVNAGSIILDNKGGITAASTSGALGSIELQTGRLQINNGIINASTSGAGAGGNISIRASESVEVAGAGLENLRQRITIPAINGTLESENFDQGIIAVTDGEGAAGNVSIETRNFIARDGAAIGTSTFGSGKGGNVTINASDTLALDNSLLATGSFTNAPSGDVNLTARKLTARGGAQVLTTTFGSGRAGNLTVNVSDSINLSNPSNLSTLLGTGLFASSASRASGNGGDIYINIPNGDLNILDGAAVSVSARGGGNAGDINIDARSIFLDKGSITATSNTGEGGNIYLQVSDNVILRNSSQISTRAGGEGSGGGNGGNIDIDSKFILAVPQENSDITANAFRGRGGDININAKGIFGLQVSEELTPNSDITASSQLGIDGSININTPGVDPITRLTELPANIIDSANQIVAACATDRDNSFVITGRGGLPENPTNYLLLQVVLQDPRNFYSENQPASSTTSNHRPIKINNIEGISQASTNDNQAIIEAQGWKIDENGTVILTSEASGGRLPSSGVPSLFCR
jgi:filamentous hemagglutinin family protein